MNDLERRLAGVPRAEPSDQLDHAIETMLRWAEYDRQRRRWRWRPVWYVLAGCTAGLVLGLLLGPLVARGPAAATTTTPTTVVIVAPSPELERWLTAGDQSAGLGFLEREHTVLETQFVAGQDRHDPPGSL